MFLTVKFEKKIRILVTNSRVYYSKLFIWFEFEKLVYVYSPTDFTSYRGRNCCLMFLFNITVLYTCIQSS